MERGKYISKKEAAALQGIAVCLMVFHHLFGFPERIHVPYVLNLNIFNFEIILSYFGKFCIAIFAFVSGYGLQKKYNSMAETSIVSGYKMVLKQLLHFFVKYWIVFVVFVPLGMLIGVYTFDWMHFIKGFIGWSDFYNAEWWYVSYYVRFVLLFPLVYFVLSWVSKKIPWRGIACITIVMMVVLAIVPASNFWEYFLCFFAGMVCVEISLFERVTSGIPKWCVYILAVVLLGASSLIRVGILGVGIPDYVLVIGFVFGVTTLLKTKLFGIVSAAFGFIGKYTTYIWLVHTFFAYYYFQSITFIPRYSTLVFVWCMVLSIATGMVLDLADRGIWKLTGKTKKA